MGKLIAVLSLVVLLIPGVASANLLLNPGFEFSGEDGHMTGWSAAPTDGWNASNISGTLDNPHSGAYAAKNFWDGGRWQNVAVTGGQEYRLTGWVHIPSGVGGSPWNSFIGFKWLRATGTTAGSWETSFKDLPRDQYNQGDSGFRVAPLDAVTAKVKFGTWSSDPFAPVNPTEFDDFDFSPIPEPTSLLLLGSGLVGLVGLTKRKKA